jgi:hypothetical protein
MKRLPIHLAIAALLLVLTLGNTVLAFVCCNQDEDCCAAHNPKDISCCCNTIIVAAPETVVSMNACTSALCDPSFFEFDHHFESGIDHPPRIS